MSAGQAKQSGGTGCVKVLKQTSRVDTWKGCAWLQWGRFNIAQLRESCTMWALQPCLYFTYIASWARECESVDTHCGVHEQQSTCKTSAFTARGEMERELDM